jgi:hypothetical protein
LVWLTEEATDLAELVQRAQWPVALAEEDGMADILSIWGASVTLRTARLNREL